MRIQKKQLIVLAGLVLAGIAVLTCVLLLGGRGDKSDSSEEITVFSLEGDITEIRVTGKQSYVVSCEEDGTCYVSFAAESGDTTVSEQEMNRECFDRMKQVLETVTSPVDIADVTDFDQYGLEEPLLTIEISSLSSAAQVHRLDIGAFSQAASMYYARLDGSSHVYLLTTLIEIAFDQTEQDLIKK